MFNVCPRCGQYMVEKSIVWPGPVAVCPHCGYGQPFVQLPLFIITGASGSGKTVVALALAPVLRREAVVLEGDILWGPEFATPEDGYRRFHEVWLRVAKNVGQSGLPVILLGTFLPHQLAKLPERRYFSDLHFLGLVADDAELASRLRNRPAWRKSSDPDFIDAMLRLNAWLKVNAAETKPPIELLDTSTLDRGQVVDQVAAWFLSHYAGS